MAPGQLEGALVWFPLPSDYHRDSIARGPVDMNGVLRLRVKEGEQRERAAVAARTGHLFTRFH